MSGNLELKLAHGREYDLVSVFGYDSGLTPNGLPVFTGLSRRGFEGLAIPEGILTFNKQGGRFRSRVCGMCRG